MRIVRRSIAALLGAGTAFLLGASSSQAAVFCVQDPACVSGGGATQPTLQAAFDAADGNGSGIDTVRIGATPTPIAGGSTSTAVEVIGAGQAQTTITAPSGTVIDLNSTSSTIRDLTVRLAGSAGKGLETSGPATRVTVDGTSSALVYPALTVGPGASSDLTVDVPAPNLALGLGAINPTLAPAPNITLENVKVEATVVGIVVPGAGTTATLRRSTFIGENGGIQAGPGTLIVESTTIETSGSPTNAALGTDNLVGGDAAVTARHVTFVGPGTGLAVRSAAGCASPGVPAASNVVVKSSIIRGFSVDFSRQGRTCGAATSPANIAVDHSIFDPAKLFQTDAGSLTQGAGNLNVDPLFVNAAAGDYALGTGSPAIDAGDPAGLGAGESATDLAGNPRVTDGNDDGTVRTDMGAFEVPAVVKPPDPPASGEFARQVSLKYSAKKKKTFTGSVASSEGACTDATVDVLMAGKKGKTKRIGTAKSNDGEFSLKKKAKKGKYFATVAESTVTAGKCLEGKSKTVKVKGKKKRK